ncbi:hypothetical protein [Pseudoalteromonas sp. S1688]|uniref:hypothetical protein n=1 Tax=Pseudoalteromonas sp. S1688 TaxID=579511 RepID=UPI002016D9AB|nr:hypothetical protein [Pseudoalteromonas sp. S1688]
MRISYTQIIIYKKEIELKEHENELHDFIYTMEASEQKKVIILEKISGYQS